MKKKSLVTTEAIERQHKDPRRLNNIHNPHTTSTPPNIKNKEICMPLIKEQ